jgi:hypothetical protein
MSEKRNQKVSQARIRHIVKHGVWSVASMRAIVSRLVREDEAQDLAEYGIALAVIGTVAGGVALVVASDVGTIWSNAQSTISLFV